MILKNVIKGKPDRHADQKEAISARKYATSAKAKSTAV